MSSNNPVASEPDKKPSEKEKPEDATQNPNPDQHDIAAKEVKQKGEKRKAEPGKVTTTAREERDKQRSNLAHYWNPQMGIYDSCILELLLLVYCWCPPFSLVIIFVYKID